MRFTRWTWTRLGAVITTLLVAVGGALLAANAASGSGAGSACPASDHLAEVQAFLEQHGGLTDGNGGPPPVSCAKAGAIWATQIEPPGWNASRPPIDPNRTLPSNTVPPTTLPSDNNQIVTDPSIITQDAHYDNTITAFWKHQEGNYWVEVQSGEQRSTGDGDIFVDIENPQGFVISPSGQPVPQTTGTINGYGGGYYTTTTAVGALTLTNVTGSLQGGNLTIEFSYNEGTGSLVLPAGTLTLS
jgi:hypothetical protein